MSIKKQPCTNTNGHLVKNSMGIRLANEMSTCSHCAVLITQRGVYNHLAIVMNNVYKCMKYEVMRYKECVGCYPDFSNREYTAISIKVVHE